MQLDLTKEHFDELYKLFGKRFVASMPIEECFEGLVNDLTIWGGSSSLVRPAATFLP